MNHSVKQSELRQLERKLLKSGTGTRLKPQLHLARIRWNTNTHGFAKRVMDVSVASVALFLLSPMLLIVALLIKLQDGGPVLFWQDRVGKMGKVFRFPKFRSMVVNSEAIRARLLAENEHGGAGVTFKMTNDPRITPVGRFIRKFSIDELPQMWSVITGEMSLVGPRPALPSEVALYSAHHRQRLHAAPGLTCYWQVSGRSSIPFEQQVELDIQYIREQNFWVDASLLIKTVLVVLTARGAS